MKNDLSVDCWAVLKMIWTNSWRTGTTSWRTGSIRKESEDPAASEEVRKFVRQDSITKLDSFRRASNRRETGPHGIVCAPDIKGRLWQFIGFMCVLTLESPMRVKTDILKQSRNPDRKSRRHVDYVYFGNLGRVICFPFVRRNSMASQGSFSW